MFSIIFFYIKNGVFSTFCQYFAFKTIGQIICLHRLRGPGGLMGYVVELPNNSYKPITNTVWARAQLYKLQKGALDTQPQVIQFTSCLPLVGGLLCVLRLLPPLKLVVII